MALNIEDSLQKRIISTVQVQNGDCILDVGCGEGTFGILTKLKFPKSTVIGLDPDAEALATAQEDARIENAEVTFIQGVAEEIPYKANTFDIVVSSLAFHHLSRATKQQAIREIYRVLKPKGTFYLIDIGKPKNIIWKFFISMTARLEPESFIKEQIKIDLPHDLHKLGFSVSEVREPYFGIYFWQAKKS